MSHCSHLPPQSACHLQTGALTLGCQVRVQIAKIFLQIEQWTILESETGIGQRSNNDIISDIITSLHVLQLHNDVVVHINLISSFGKTSLGRLSD